MRRDPGDAAADAYRDRGVGTGLQEYTVVACKVTRNRTRDLHLFRKVADLLENSKLLINLR
jgi:hypothetical protein